MQVAVLRTLLFCSLAWGCSDVYVGSDVLWSAQHETGDLSEWSAQGAGTSEVEDGDGSISVSDAFAHGGRYGVRLEKVVTRSTAAGAGPRLIRFGDLPKRAVYSAWFLLPRIHRTSSYWTFMQWDSAAASSPVEDRGVNLQLRSLPDQNGLVLQVFFHTPAYLAAPIAYPTPLVPIGRWFNVTVDFEAATDTAGRVTVWLDGQPIYDLAGRPTIDPESLEFLITNMMVDVEPSPVELYVDDVVISKARAR
ncbi:MAG: hypothetical protein ACOY0T_04360 [Myxococcota bacterium]